MPKKQQQNPNEIVHLQVAEGETVIHKNISYGRAPRCKSGVGTSTGWPASTPKFTRTQSPTWRIGSRCPMIFGWDRVSPEIVARSRPRRRCGGCSPTAAGCAGMESLGCSGGSVPACLGSASPFPRMSVRGS